MTIWDDYRQLDSPRDNQQWRSAWYRLCDYGAVVSQLRRELAADDAKLAERLKVTWEQVSSEFAREAIRNYYRTEQQFSGLAIDADWIHDSLRRIVASTGAVWAARHYDGQALARWATRAVKADEGRLVAANQQWVARDERESDYATLTRQLLDTQFKALHEAGYTVGPARDCAFDLIPPEGQPRNIQIDRRLYILGYRQRGFVATLHVEVVEGGIGECYARQDEMGFRPITDSFLQATNVAWEAAKHHVPAGQRKLDLSRADIRWWVEGTDLAALDGGSLGAALAIASVHALCNQPPLEEDWAITAEIRPDGTLGSVGQVTQKAKAAFSFLGQYNRHRITRILVHPSNRAEAVKAAEKLGLDSEEAVTSADSLDGALQAILKHSQSMLRRMASGSLGAATELEKFEHFYLGTPEAPTPFGGRDEPLDELDKWLDDPDARPYRLLQAPAGRGKSALLVRWVRRLRRQKDLAVVFFPVSIRFGTNLSTKILPGLAAQLAKCLGRPLPSDPNLPPDQWRAEVYDCLKNCGAKKLVIILDGIDESADFERHLSLLFPDEPPRSLRVVVSARQRPDDANGSSWLRALGWDNISHLMEQSTLVALSQVGLADVLRRMGFPLESLSRRVDIVAELHRLSEGDPLLVDLYVRELWTRGEQAARLQPEELEKLQPGLKGFFDSLMNHQEQLWGDRADRRRAGLAAVRDILACAMGPLQQEDILRLTGIKKSQLNDAIATFSRFIIGDGRTQGYTYSHSKLAAYFYEEELGESERQEWEDTFLEWGRTTVERLEQRELAPADVPRYLLQYYGAHIEPAEERRPKLLKQAEQIQYLVPLTNEPWQRAWETFDGGSYAGFLSGVEQLRRTCHMEDLAAVEVDQPAPYLGQEIRCALIQASVNSLASNIPIKLLVALCAKGIWTPALALAYVYQIPYKPQQVAAIAALLPYLTNQDMKDVAISSGLAAATQIADEDDRARALAWLAPELDDPLRQKVLAEALGSARQITHNYWRADALIKIGTHLEDSLRQNVSREAYDAARSIKDEKLRAEALAKVAACLDVALRRTAATEALAAAKTIKDKHHQAEALATIAPELDPPLRQEIMAKALAAAKEESSEIFRTHALAIIAPLLENPLRKKVLAEVLAGTERILDDLDGESWGSWALAAIAPYFNPTQLTEAATAARQAAKKNGWPEPLIALAPHVRPPLRQTVLAEALAATCQIECEFGDASYDAQKRHKALAELAPHLEPTQLVEALEAARQIGDKYHRARALAALAPHLDPTQQTEALAAARQIEGDVGWDVQAESLAALAPHLNRSLLTGAFELAKQIEYNNLRAEALAAIVPRLSGQLRQKVSSEALAAARQIEDGDQRAKTLGVVAAHLADLPRQKVLARALAASRKITDRYWKAEALAVVAPQLRNPLRQKVLSEALEAARQIKDKFDRFKAMSTFVVPQLEPPLRQKVVSDALSIAKEIADEFKRAKALASLVPHSGDTLGPKLLSEALSAVNEMDDDELRARALAWFAPLLDDSLREDVLFEALVAIKLIEDDDYRTEELADLSPHLAQLDRPALFNIWSTASLLPFDGLRRELLADLFALVPVIERLGVAETGHQTGRAILEVTRRWP